MPLGLPISEWSDKKMSYLMTLCHDLYFLQWFECTSSTKEFKLYIKVFDWYKKVDTLLCRLSLVCNVLNLFSYQAKTFKQSF